MKSEPAYQIQHDRFIVSFYPEELTDRASVQRAAEAHLRAAYGLRQQEPPATLADDAARLTEQVVRDMGIA